MAVSFISGGNKRVLRENHRSAASHLQKTTYLPQVTYRKPPICRKSLTENHRSATSHLQKTTDLPQVTYRKPPICHKSLTENHLSAASHLQKTTDLPQVTYKLYHVMMFRIHLTILIELVKHKKKHDM